MMGVTNTCAGDSGAGSADGPQEAVGTKTEGQTCFSNRPNSGCAAGLRCAEFKLPDMSDMMEEKMGDNPMAAAMLGAMGGM